MRTYKLIIPLIPPSLNRFAGRKNEWEYRELKQEWKQTVMWYSAAAGYRQPAAPERALIEITYFFPDKRGRDPDNYSGKMILDGLTAAGLIKDDSFDRIVLKLRGETDKVHPRTEITITELTEDEQ